MNHQELAPVMFFDGEEHLATAGALLLENRNVDAVVIRNVAQTALLSLGRQPDQQGETVREALFTDMPHVSELDTYVQRYHEKTSLSKRYQLTTIADTERIITRSGATGLHIDSPFGAGRYATADSYEGPLTMSIRLDTLPIPRIFQVQRTHDMLLSAMASGTNQSRTEGLYRTMAAITRANHAGMHVIDQRPGDAVIIANYPTPTMHAIDAKPRSATRSLVASYMLRESTLPA